MGFALWKWVSRFGFETLDVLKANEAQRGSCEWNSSQGQLTAQRAFKTKTLGIQRALKQLWTVLSCWVIHWGLLWSRTRTNPPWLEKGCEIFHTLCRYSCALPQRLGDVCPHPDHWGQWQMQTFNSRGTGSTEMISLPSPPLFSCVNVTWQCPARGEFPLPQTFLCASCIHLGMLHNGWMCWV